MHGVLQRGGTAQGTLAGAGGFLLGAGVSFLPLDDAIGIVLVVLGAGMVVLRAILRHATARPVPLPPQGPSNREALLAELRDITRRVEDLDAALRGSQGGD